MTGVPISQLVQGATGIAVALSLALVVARRTRSMIAICAAQTAAVCLAAVAQGRYGAAAVVMAEAAAMAGIGSSWLPGIARFLPRYCSRDAVGTGAPVLPIAAAVALVLLAVVVPGAGLPFAVILPGLLLLATRPSLWQQAAGAMAMQNGLMLAALSAGLSPPALAAVTVPLVPALAVAALWTDVAQPRQVWPSWLWLAARAESALCGLALLAACMLPVRVGAAGAFWRLDTRAALFVLLLCALATAGSVARRDARGPGLRLVLLAGTVAAVLADQPLLTWLGMALATAAAALRPLPTGAEVPDRLRTGCAGLALALFGSVAPEAAPVATAAMIAGYGLTGLLAPELAIAAVAAILRLRGMPGADALLPFLGLVALLAPAPALLSMPGPRRTLPLVGLAQAGVAVFAFGLGTAAGDLAGLLQITFLGLTQCALLLARRGGLDRLAALVGLAGAPPFGLFASLASVVTAAAAAAPALLLPLGGGLAVVLVAVLRQLPRRVRLLPSFAWLPLALLVLGGFAMPAPVLDWLREAAR